LLHATIAESRPSTREGHEEEELVKKLIAMAASLAMAAVLVLPSVAVASPDPLLLGGVDQQTAGPGDLFTFSATVEQTVTPQKTGLLSHVDFYCARALSLFADASIDLTVGATTVNVTCDSSGPLIVDFSSDLFSVEAGVPFTMYLTSTESAADPILRLASSNYAGGALTEGGVDLDGYAVEDLFFSTYVIEKPTASYAWNKSSVAAGVSTEVTLTETFNYPEMLVNGVAPSQVQPALPIEGSIGYAVAFEPIPAWFVPSSVVCSSQIDVSDCIVGKLVSGMVVSASQSAMTVTVAVTGTVTPPSGATTLRSLYGMNCIVMGSLSSPVTTCGNTQALLGVGGPAATPPVSSTADSAPAPWSGTPSLLLILVGLFGSAMALGAVVLVARRSRS
jgi:hypothetical protein